MELDVERLGCDLLSATGRKYLRGPRGSGFLYVRKSMLDRLDPPFLDLHGATWTEAGPLPHAARCARRFENWEFNYAAVIGLGVAVDYALAWGLDAIEARVTALAEALRARLSAIPGVCTCMTWARGAAASSASATRAGSAAEVERALARQNINISTSSVSFDLAGHGETRPRRPRPGLGPLLQHRRRSWSASRRPSRNFRRPLRAAPGSGRWPWQVLQLQLAALVEGDAAAEQAAGRRLGP